MKPTKQKGKDHRKTEKDEIIYQNLLGIKQKYGINKEKDFAVKIGLDPKHWSALKNGVYGFGSIIMPRIIGGLKKNFGLDLTEKELLQVVKTEKGLLVPREVYEIYPRVGWLMDQVTEMAKSKPSAEKLIRYAMKLLDSELERQSPKPIKGDGKKH